MPIFSCDVDEAHEGILLLTGTPDELRVEDDLFVDAVAGFTVKRVAAGGQHDGHSAHIVTLADDMGKRDIGRMILRDDVDYKEEVFSWERIFEFTNDMHDFHNQWKKSKSKIQHGAVVSTVIPFCWEMYPSLQYGMAATAAEYGVSITKHSMDGGDGGWPEIKVTGLRANVERLLREGWQYSDEMVAEDLDS